MGKEGLARAGAEEAKMMDPILAQQDQKRQNQKRQRWDRQAWRVAGQTIILVRLHYRGASVGGVAGFRGRASAVVAADGASWSVNGR